eukprot:CAMPEP_0184865192 /NCGR_PEP_ID=MMETSP0580-20130426/17267_1 /TAXON_ID=1118495 /ORGANISM="Dactyliosolen fragilissimus" /LENGTH=381 /DNA_ID=CAMNT_0027364289 /DNA_START=76 /DNA_END=1221 /DNA_ORIENTATION=-
MTFGWPGQTSSEVDNLVAKDMLQCFVEYEERRKRFCEMEKDGASSALSLVDTARIYAGGKTESMLGSVLNHSFSENDAGMSFLDCVSIGTKAHPSQNGGLSNSGIRDQLDTSLSQMGLSSVGEFYLHQPDIDNPLRESLETCKQLMEEGLIESLGMSNYHVTEMERAIQIWNQDFQKINTKQKSKHTLVYQGLYNPLNRSVEEELLPLLKRHQCSFVAYNPLAAGLLTGKHSPPPPKDDPNAREYSVPQGRFKNNPNYLPRFYTQSNFEALRIIQDACQKENISLLQASFTWLIRHSALSEHDGILIGASSLAQLQQNLDACYHASLEPNALSQDILQAFDQAWEITKNNEPFPYWRSYSSDMPNRDHLDQGASYSASTNK